MTPLPTITCDAAPCGACCDAQGTPPFAHTPGDSPPPHLAWNVKAHARRYDEGLPCLWLDTATKLCRHYAHRPEACRTAVVPGDEFCRGFRAERGLT